MKIYTEMEQGSLEWLKLRLGTVTGTRLKDIFKSNNLGLMDELISEELSSEMPEEMRVSGAMQRGSDLEPIAMGEYKDLTFYDVETPAFIRHSDIDFLGFSPDGLIKKDGKYIGGVEIKCPSSKKHIEYIRTGTVPAIYKYQILSYFINCEDLEWVDFVSFDDRVNIKPLHKIRVLRTELQKDIDETIKGIHKFNEKRANYFKQITG